MCLAHVPNAKVALIAICFAPHTLNNGLCFGCQNWPIRAHVIIFRTVEGTFKSSNFSYWYRFPKIVTIKQQVTLTFEIWYIIHFNCQPLTSLDQKHQPNVLNLPFDMRRYCIWYKRKSFHALINTLSMFFVWYILIFNCHPLIKYIIAQSTKLAFWHGKVMYLIKKEIFPCSYK